MMKGTSDPRWIPTRGVTWEKKEEEEELIRKRVRFKALSLTGRNKAAGGEGETLVNRDSGTVRETETHLQALLPPDQLGVVTGVHVPAQVLMEINQAVVEENVPLRQETSDMFSFVI